MSAPEDPYLADFLGAMALRAALRGGLIDLLLARSRVVSSLGPALGVPGEGLATLVGLLGAAGVCRLDGDCVALTVSFRRVLDLRRAALEARLEFLAIAARDIAGFGAELFLDLRRFMSGAQTFALFRYDLALDIAPGNLAATRPWVNYVTALTEAEAPSLVPHIRLSGVRRLLEIGGNSGAFALALLERHPTLEVVVMDLPAVCEIGRLRSAGLAGSERLRFIAGDARSGPWPGPVDAVMFKSVLHDWPDHEAGAMLDRALGVLRPGGTLVICERGPVESGAGPQPFARAADIVFAPFFRSSERYTTMLAASGVRSTDVCRLPSPEGFYVVQAEK